MQMVEKIGDARDPVPSRLPHTNARVKEAKRDHNMRQKLPDLPLNLRGEEVRSG
jgi:hypothetical protein